MNSQKGQALAEVCYISFFVMAFVTLIFSISYSIYAKEISSYHLYRALLCTEEFEVKTKTCILNLENDLQNSLFFHKQLIFTKDINSKKRTITLNAQFFSFHSRYTRKLEVKSP